MTDLVSGNVQSMANDLSRLSVNSWARGTPTGRGDTPDRTHVSKECDSPSLHSSLMSVEASPRCYFTPRPAEGSAQPLVDSGESSARGACWGQRALSRTTMAAIRCA